MSFSAPGVSMITRESIPVATLNAMRFVMFALMRPVTTFELGRWVATMRWIPAARAELGDTHNRGLDVLARNHHEVGELVDDDDEVGHLGQLAGGLRRLRSLSAPEACFALYWSILSHAHALEDFQAALHLGHSP